ncbi:MAG: hypothetical protein F8N15_00965 [Methanobacterium sp.]|nr:hypothetical protein [Methanobacterium sp.]
MKIKISIIKLMNIYIFCSLFIIFPCCKPVFADNLHIYDTQDNWRVVDTSKIVTGKFFGENVLYGAAVVSNGQNKNRAIVVFSLNKSSKNFTIMEFNEKLKQSDIIISIVHPGKYDTSCKNWKNCPQIILKNDAIGVCYGEESCEIVYYEDNAFKEVFLTD